MSQGPVDVLMSEHEAVLEHLVASGEASFASTLELSVPKVFLLAAASWLEVQVQAVLSDFFLEVAGSRKQAHEFVRIQALDRKFHTWFDWNGRNPSVFFSKFGPDMKRYGMSRYRADEDFALQYDAFLELGSLRNQLVHQNYAAFSVPKTAHEVRDLFKLAEKFVGELPDLLRSKVDGSLEQTP